MPLRMEWNVIHSFLLTKIKETRIYQGKQSIVIINDIIGKLAGEGQHLNHRK